MWIHKMMFGAFKLKLGKGFVDINSLGKTKTLKC